MSPKSEKPLSPKQLEGAKLQSQGLTQGEVAKRLDISRRCVELWNSKTSYKSLVASLMSSKIGATQTDSRSDCSQSPITTTSAESVEDLLIPAIRAVESCLSDESRPSDKLKAASLIFSLLGLGQDMNTHISGLRHYGLNIIQDQDGRFVLTDERFTDSLE
jgi:hypothetical protein